jgi:monovalent cation/proton antiporter MnhG/PhaG subunit
VSVRDVLVGLLLVLGVGVTLISSLGVLLMRDAYDRLHYTGPASTVAPVAIAAAIVVEEGLSAVSAKTVLIVAVILFTNPLLVHATARAGRVREHGAWTVRPGENLEVGGP